jgi:hypothetical protein
MAHLYSHALPPIITAQALWVKILPLDIHRPLTLTTSGCVTEILLCALWMEVEMMDTGPT